MGSLLQSDIADEVVRCLTGQLLHLSVQVDAAETYLFGNGIDAEVGIADVLVDDLHDTFEQLLVRRLHLDLVDLFFELVVASVLQAEHLMGMDQIDDGTAQDIHIEGLGDVGVGTHFQSFELVLVTALGCEQDDGDVPGGGI